MPILTTCLLIGVTSVNAGPNADGTLILHTNPSVVWTVDPTNYCGVSGLATCDAAINSVQGSATSVVFAIAAFPPSSLPRLAGITFGVNYPVMIVIVGYGSCGEFELDSDGWPSPLTGTAVTFVPARTTELVECYWFAAYNYYGSLQSGSLWLIPHPSLGGSFVDDSVPSIVDGISAYGSLGFDEPGHTPCPQVSLPGACCYPDGLCVVEIEENCLGHGGIYQGVGTTCVPNPCPQPIGACCLQDLTCVDVIAVECASLGGTFLGLGIPCDPNPCGTLTLDDDGVPNAWASDPDTLTALLRDHVGEVVPEYPVVLSVALGPNATLTLGPTLTDPNGVATFSYDNPSESTGTDVLQAFTAAGARDTPIASNLAVAPKVRAKVEVEIPNNKTTLPGFPTTVLVYVTNESDVPISGEVRVDMDPADVVPMDDPDPPWPVENLAPGERKGPFKLLARTCKKVGTPIRAAFYLDKPAGPKKLASLPQNPPVTLVPRTEPVTERFGSFGFGGVDDPWDVKCVVVLTPIEQNGQFTSVRVQVHGMYEMASTVFGGVFLPPSHITIDHPKAGARRNDRAQHGIDGSDLSVDDAVGGWFQFRYFDIPCDEAISLSSNPIEVKCLGISKDGVPLKQHVKWTNKETIIAKKTGQLLAVPQWDIAATIPVVNSGLLPVDVELAVTEIGPNWSIELEPSNFSLDPEEVRFVSVDGTGSGAMSQGFPILVDEVHPATADTIRWEIPVLLEREFADEIVVSDSLAFSFCDVTVRGGIHLTGGGILDVSNSLVHCAEEGLAVRCDPGGKLSVDSSVLSAVDGDGVVLQGTTSLRNAVIAGFNQGVVQAGGHLEITGAQIEAVGTALDVSACDTTSFVVLPSTVSGTGPAIRVSSCPALVLAGPSGGIVGAPLVVNESNIDLRSPVFPVEGVQSDGTSAVDISYLLGFQVIGPDSSGIEGADVTVTSHDSVVLADDWVTDGNGLTSRRYVTLARIDGGQLEYASPLQVDVSAFGDTFGIQMTVDRDSVLTVMIAPPEVWDLAADWSASLNPGSVWSYEGGGHDPLPVHWNDWDADRAYFSSAQPGWADGQTPNPNHFPVWLKAAAPSSLDLPMGRVAGHSSEAGRGSISLSWTSPVSGAVRVFGGLWLADMDPCHGSDWSLSHNSLPFASGRLAATSGYSSERPARFEDFNIEPDSLTRNVAIGDLISLLLTRPDSSASWVGVDLRVGRPDSLNVGACCFTGDASCIVRLEVECLADGGEYRGHGSACDVTPCDGVPLQFAVETVEGGNVGGFTSIDVDNLGDPHISYAAAGDLKYAHKSGGSWAFELADTQDEVGFFTSIDVDAINRPHISYFDVTNQDLKYAVKDGAVWMVERVDGVSDNSGQFTSIAVDGSGHPHISYTGGDYPNVSELRYARRDEGGWSTERVEPPGTPSHGTHTALALDGQGDPHIVYYSGALTLASRKCGTWTIEDVDTQCNGSAGTGRYPSIAIDAAGTPHISYENSCSGTLLYATKVDGLWVIEQVDSPGVELYTSIELGPMGEPRITYWDGPPEADLRLAVRQQGAWILSTIDTDGVVGTWNGLATFNAGREYHVSYRDDSGFSLNYAAGNVDVSDAPDTDAPGPRLLLSQPIPNPSTDGVRFSVTVGVESVVHVRILDVSGRVVESIVDGTLRRGTHSFSWAARISGDSRTKRGVYFVDARTPGVESVRKIVLIK